MSDWVQWQAIKTDKYPHAKNMKTHFEGQFSFLDGAYNF